MACPLRWDNRIEVQAAGALFVFKRSYLAPKPAPLESRKAARLARMATRRMRVFFMCDTSSHGSKFPRIR
jgi:hypothetical protein